MTEMGLPAESQANKPRGSTMDAVLTVVITILAMSVVVLGIYWGYSWWLSTKVDTQASPATRTIALLKTDVAQHPQNAAVRVRLAEALATAGLNDEATAQLKQAVTIDPKHTGAWLDLGSIAFQAGKSQEAATYFTKVVALTEGSQMADVNQRREEALFALGQIAINDKRYDDALRYVKGALRIRRDASDSYLLLAQAYKGNGDIAKAVQNLNIALTFDPNMAQANYELGLILQSQGKTHDAADRLRKAVDNAPKTAPAAAALAAIGPASKWLALAQTKIAAHDLKNAKLDLETALAVDSSSVPTALLYASVLEQLGKKGSALQAYQQVLQEDPTNKTATAAVARLSSVKK